MTLYAHMYLDAPWSSTAGFPFLSPTVWVLLDTLACESHVSFPLGMCVWTETHNGKNVAMAPHVFVPSTLMEVDSWSGD